MPRPGSPQHWHAARPSKRCWSLAPASGHLSIKVDTLSGGCPSQLNPTPGSYVHLADVPVRQPAGTAEVLTQDQAHTRTVRTLCIHASLAGPALLAPWGPCDYVRLKIPSVSSVECHPFSVASLPVVGATHGNRQPHSCCSSCAGCRMQNTSRGAKATRVMAAFIAGTGCCSTCGLFRCAFLRPERMLSE